MRSPQGRDLGSLYISCLLQYRHSKNELNISLLSFINANQDSVQLSCLAKTLSLSHQNCYKMIVRYWWLFFTKKSALRYVLLNVYCLLYFLVAVSIFDAWRVCDAILMSVMAVWCLYDEWNLWYMLVLCDMCVCVGGTCDRMLKQCLPDACVMSVKYL